jgi:leucyl/phenylalanyl-tRNA---protein transferase
MIQPVFLSTADQPFPFPYDSDDEGLVAVGGGLSVSRLLQAYSIGLFPWFEEEGLPFWFSPNPRCVLYPADLRVSKSMKQLIRNQKFHITVDQDFSAVIQQCASVDRKGQGDTWISAAFRDAYIQLFRAGYAHSVEVWNEQNVIVGGLYGVLIGKVFFGESMFSRESNASKIGLIHYVHLLSNLGVQLIDCQQETPHLLSLGAVSIPRSIFLSQVSLLAKQ